MGNLWSDIVGTSKNVFKLKKGKLSLDANSVLNNRTVSFGEHDINLATAALGDVLTKTGATTMGFQAPGGGGSSFFTLTGPVNMSGVYAGDVYVNGTITMTADVFIHGDLIFDPAGTNIITNAGGAYSLAVKGDIRSVTTNSLAGGGTINLNGTSGATPTNGGSLFVGGDINCKAIITLNGGNRTSGDGVGGNTGYCYINGSVKFCNITSNSGNANSTAFGNNHLPGICRAIIIFGSIEGDSLFAGYGTGTITSTAGINRSTSQRPGGNIYIFGDIYGVELYTNGCTANTYSGKIGGNGGDINISGDVNNALIYSNGGAHSTNLGSGGSGGSIGVYGKVTRGNFYSVGGDGSDGGFGGIISIDTVIAANVVSMGGTGNTSSGGGAGGVYVNLMAGDMDSSSLMAIGGNANTSGQSPGNGGNITVHGYCSAATLSVIGGQNNATSRRADAGSLTLRSQASVGVINAYGDSSGPAGRAAQVILNGGVFKEINLTSVVAGGFLKLSRGQHFISSLTGDSTYTEFKTTFSDDGIQPNVSFKVAVKSGIIQFKNLNTSLTEDVKTDTTYIMNNEGGQGRWDLMISRAVFYGPANINGTYRGDVYLDCTSGNVTLVADLIVEGNLFIKGPNGLVNAASPFNVTVKKDLRFEDNTSYMKLGDDGVTLYPLNSANLTVHGSIIGFDLNAPNVINLKGYSGYAGSIGGNGGNLLVNKDFLNIDFTSAGGAADGATFLSGTGGTITILGDVSSQGNIIASGGTGINSADGGGGGNITLYGNYMAGAISSNGGDGIIAGAGGVIAISGQVTAAASISASGGSGLSGGNSVGGNGGNISVTADCYASLSSNGGLSMDATNAVSAGNGGVITVGGRLKGNASSWGGNNANTSVGTNGGNGGSVTVTEDMIGAIQNYGGNAWLAGNPGTGGATTINGKLRGSVNCSGGQNLTSSAYAQAGNAYIYDADNGSLTQWSGAGQPARSIGGHWTSVNITDNHATPHNLNITKSTHIKDLTTNITNQAYIFSASQISVLFSAKQTASGLGIKLSFATLDFLDFNLYMAVPQSNNWVETAMTLVV